MSKNIHTPREELVCGKIDKLEDHLAKLGISDLAYLISEIRNDCERMEAKLADRKKEVSDLLIGVHEGRKAQEKYMKICEQLIVDEKDAKRYRWLRYNNGYSIRCNLFCYAPMHEHRDIDLDYLIDNELKWDKKND